MTSKVESPMPFLAAATRPSEEGTPSGLWHDVQDAIPLDIYVEFEDGTFSRPVLCTKTGRLRRLEDVQRESLK